MSRSARTSNATVSLLQHVELGATGRARVGAGAASVEVCLLGGQILAAQAPDDVRQLIRLCHLRGGLTDVQAAHLDERPSSPAGEPPAFGRLLDAAPPELMEQLLFDRFRQNLATFCGSLDKPDWEPTRAVFVDNLQMPADAAAIVEECARMWDEASSLDLDAELVRGRGRLDNKEQRLVAAKLGKSPQSVASLLQQLPMEPLVARVVILDMLRSGAAQVPAAEVDDEDVDDEPTVYARDDDATEQVVVPPADAAPAPVSHVRVVPDPDPAPASEPDEADGPGSLTSLSAWLDAAASVDDDELGFFSDHDYERGSADDGAFSTESHNLDRVEVTPVAPGVIEADEAPTTRFSAPVLSEDEALGKIGVANEVLSLVVRAFDEVEGAGRGRAVVQLLVDGSPSRYAALLHDVQIDDLGRLPDAEILDNLYGRPHTEHRQLINSTLVDIIERALSSAADELPDEAFDQVLERVAGYRQRLGL